MGIAGGTFERETFPGPDAAWTASISLSAERTCLAGPTVRNYGIGVSIVGARDVILQGASFAEGRNSAIGIWPGDGETTTRGVVVRDCHIVQAFDHGADAPAGTSPIIARGERGGELFAIPGIQIVGCDIDQGPMRKGETMVGWFGIELKTAEGCVVSGNRLRGGFAQVSLPDSDGCRLEGNRFDLTHETRGEAGRNHPWGIELAASNRATVVDNVFVGSGWGVAVSMNSGSRDATVERNVACDLGALVYFTAEGGGHSVADNCMRGVGMTCPGTSSPDDAWHCFPPGDGSSVAAGDGCSDDDFAACAP